MANQPQSEETSVPKSLYDRLGGVYAIAAVIDDLIDRVMDNPRLNANPKVDEAHHRVSRAGFKYLVTELVCGATGVPSSIPGVPCGIPMCISTLPKRSGRCSWRTYGRVLLTLQCPRPSRGRLSP